MNEKERFYANQAKKGIVTKQQAVTMAKPLSLLGKFNQKLAQKQAVQPAITATKTLAQKQYSAKDVHNYNTLIGAINSPLFQSSMQISEEEKQKQQIQPKIQPEKPKSFLKKLGSSLKSFQERLSPSRSGFATLAISPIGKAPIPACKAASSFSF